MTVSNQLAQLIVVAAVRRGGLTFRLSGYVGVVPTEGWAVSLPDNEVRTPYLTAETILSYVEGHADALNYPGACLGLWLHEGEWYLDTTIVLDDEARALRMGSLWGQKAIFDLGRGMARLVPDWLQWSDDVVTGVAS